MGLAHRELLPVCFDVVPNHPPIVGVQEDVVVPGAVIVAGARLDEHHLPMEGIPLGAAEFHLSSAGDVWGAAAPVHTAATELGPVGTGAAAA